MGKNYSPFIIVALFIAIVVFVVLLEPERLQPSGTSTNYPSTGFEGQWGITPQPPSETPPTTPTNPYITLSITPNSIQRGETATITVTSNFPNTQLEVLANYDDATPWISLGYITTDSSGGYVQSSPVEPAGFWNVKLKVGNIESNVASLTVYGITIYQLKDTWNVGETYSGALTGTYRNWMVFILVKPPTSTTWNYYTSTMTNEHGVIPYGSLEQNIPPAQAGTSHNVIAIIDPSNSSGEDYWMVIEEYSGVGIPLTAFSNHVESNILTFHVS